MAARESAADEKQVVFLIGPSRGAKNGDRRTVTPEQAEALVSAGLARYPESKGK